MDTRKVTLEGQTAADVRSAPARREKAAAVQRADQVGRLGRRITPDVDPEVLENEETLCKAGETPIFSCKLKNTKIVSICTPSDNSNGYVDYRFGKKSKVELTYSANAQIPNQKFHHGEVVYANNSDEMIWFTNGKYRYSVYSPVRGGPGLSVSLRGDIVSHLECSNSGRGATEALKTPSPFIIEQGTGDLTTFEKLWGD